MAVIDYCCVPGCKRPATGYWCLEDGKKVATCDKHMMEVAEKIGRELRPNEPAPDTDEQKRVAP